MKKPAARRTLPPRKHSTLPTGYQWLVLLVPPAKERTAEVMLSAAGLTIFLPTEVRMCRVSRHAKRREPREFPALPRYLFLGVRGFIPWNDIRRYRAVIQQVLGWNGNPICLEEEAMVKMLTAMGEMEAAANARPRQITVGDHCRILSGPFANHKVRIEEIRGKRARIIINLFGDDRPAEIQIEALQIAA
jgi:transcription antitermination factor NusG